MEAISEVYESEWTGADALNAQMSAIDVLWQDFSHKLGDQVLIPLNTYTAQFPDMKKKIEKRNRKLLDYDSQRHSFEGLQANSAKRKDDVKVRAKHLNSEENQLLNYFFYLLSLKLPRSQRDVSNWKRHEELLK